MDHLSMAYLPARLDCLRDERGACEPRMTGLRGSLAPIPLGV